MSVNIALLKKIAETPGVSGREQKIRELIIAEIKNHTDSIEIDPIGNVIALIKGKQSKKVMVAAHMDEIGFMVTHIDDRGFIKFHTLGGFDPKTLTAQRVVVHGSRDLVGVMGSKPIHVLSAEDRTKAPAIGDYFIDLGMEKAEVEKYVTIGDVISRERELIEMGSCVNSKSLDNRVSVFILVEAIKKIKNPEYNLYAVFTVQEELGVRGAQAAALKIQPDFGFGLDTTIAFDVPGAKDHEKITELGKGAAIKIMDSSVVSDYRMVNYMKEIANKHKIKWQPEILTAGGTDAAALQRFVPGGSITGAISVPTRHIHQSVEMCSLSDIQDCIQLLTHCVEEVGKFNWQLQA